MLGQCDPASRDHSSCFADFADTIFKDIEAHLVPGNTDVERFFLWDNLGSYPTTTVDLVVRYRPVLRPTLFHSTPRAPYQPKWGPIEEYKILLLDVVSAVSKSAMRKWKLSDLEQAIYREAGRTIKGVGNTFSL